MGRAGHAPAGGVTPHLVTGREQRSSGGRAQTCQLRLGRGRLLGLQPGRELVAQLRRGRELPLEHHALRVEVVSDALLYVTLRSEDGLARIEVSDDGPGMSDEQLAHAFERFYRADSSRTRASGGAGLGLSIVAAVTEAHGGRVSAHSAPSGGSTFVIELPRSS